MSEEEAALREINRITDLLILCLKHEPDRVYRLRRELNDAHNRWFSVMQGIEQGR